MCGRFSQFSSWEDFQDWYGVLKSNQSCKDRYNIAPTQDAAVVRSVGGERSLSYLRWGLVPHWAGDISIGSRMINARSETAVSKPAFRDAMVSRRCLIPADAFFEWKTVGGVKQAYCIRPTGNAAFTFAGLWESWNGKSGDGAVNTFTILTCSANARLKDIHHRMPVILDPSDFDGWLAGDTALARSLLVPAPDSSVDFYPVSSLVNSVRNDEPACIEPQDVTDDRGSRGDLGQGDLFA